MSKFRVIRRVFLITKVEMIDMVKFRESARTRSGLPMFDQAEVAECHYPSHPGESTHNDFDVFLTSRPNLR